MLYLTKKYPRLNRCFDLFLSCEIIPNMKIMFRVEFMFRELFPKTKIMCWITLASAKGPEWRDVDEYLGLERSNVWVPALIKHRPKEWSQFNKKTIYIYMFYLRKLPKIKYMVWLIFILWNNSKYENYVSSLIYVSGIASQDENYVLNYIGICQRAGVEGCWWICRTWCSNVWVPALIKHRPKERRQFNSKHIFIWWNITQRKTLCFDLLFILRNVTPDKKGCFELNV